MKSRSFLFVLGIVAAIAAAGPLRGQSNETTELSDRIESSAKPAAASTAAAFEAETIDVEFSRKGTLRMVLKEESLELETPYGDLKIPAQEVASIEFATRLADGEAAAIAAAIGNLASPEFAIREAATVRLAEFGERAYPALVKAAKDGDAEVAKRAGAIATKLEATIPPERLAVRPYDVVETSHSKIAGKLKMAAIAVETTEFGGQQLRLADIRSLRSQRAKAAGLAYIKPEPDPGNMTRFQGQIGQTFAFHVTGRADSTVYGTGTYTYDSTLAVAAVHTGVLKAGETAVIHVQMVASPASFTASTQNGVTSSAWSAYPSAYRILGKGPATP